MVKKLTPDELLEIERKRKLEDKLKEAGKLGAEREAMMISFKSGLPYIDLRVFPIDKEAVSLLPKKLSREARAVCFLIKNSEVRLGVVDLKNSNLKKATGYLADKGYKFALYVISSESLEYAFRIYEQIKVVKPKRDEIEVEKEKILRAREKIKGLADLKETIKKIPITEMIDYILAGAIAASASDVHFEPEKEKVKLRYRIDGVLQDILDLPMDVYNKVLSRVKILSGLKINIVDKPQDGRFSINLDGKEVDLRVSTLATSFGETLVLRLLGTGVIGLTLDKLGLRERELGLLDKAIKSTTGMILTTGPTGSGKTTTLYACLNKVNTPDKNIITLENPIEYRLKGISQTEVNPEKGLSFAETLRSVMRQDPDIVMVGEIRDRETAEVAGQAALTGHLVFSTLHTNDAAGAIPRLISMGARPEEIAPALKLIMAQRLVRRLCDCKEEYELDEDEVKMLKEKLGKFYPQDGVKKLYRAKGCEKCDKIGYKGRIGIYEMFENDKKIEKLIGERVGNLEIEKAAVDQGMMRMEIDGLLKAIEGITSLEEVKRVI